MSSAALAARRRPGGFLEQNLSHLLGNLEAIHRADALGARRGFLQGLPARAKIVAALLLVAGVVASTSLAAILAAFAAAVLLAAGSRLQAQLLLRLVWGSVLVFTGSVLLPSLVLTPGPVLTHVPLVGWPVTVTGLHIFLLLLARAETSATWLALLALTTPWPRLLVALQSLRVPTVVIALFSTTYRYLVLLLETSIEMFHSRRSRMVGPLAGSARRQLLLATAGTLLHKTATLSQEVHSAMQARGFRGRVYPLQPEPFRFSEACTMLVALAAAVGLAAAR